MSPTRTALYGCAMALAIGLLPLPYAYYTFLRFAAVAAFVVALAVFTSATFNVVCL